MKTATITFHGSHNYGSMLQAYALQQTMIKMYGENEIINFRSPTQKRMMRVITFRPRIGALVKDMTHLFFYRKLKNKHNLFEQFQSDYLFLSDKELPAITANDLKEYDLICCGSDQIWNPCPEDFELSYLLPFDIDAKKISYAASMGPGREKWPEPISKFPELLNDFDYISVREEGTRKVVSELSGRNDVTVNCDPVFLLNKDEWNRIVNPSPIIKGEYIFLYTLFANRTIVDCAKVLSRKYGIPVIISLFTNGYDLFAPFTKILEIGPREFLNLINNAKFVVTSSFHGTAFSILFNKPFVSINGMLDNRISSLLKLCRLEDMSVSNASEIEQIDWDVDFIQSNEAILKERTTSFEYLDNCIR